MKRLLVCLLLLLAVGCEDSTHGQQPVNSITNTIGMTLNKIPAGTFLMGSPTDEIGRKLIEIQHKVTISFGLPSFIDLIHLLDLL